MQPYISFKLEPVGDPRPARAAAAFEIFVYSPRVEGVHLRFGAVARGGLRWSDRRDDFRTEVLGLVKAQMVKNTVIVPVGAKGGFFCKQLPDPGDRDAWLAEGIACYTTFISGLLDITDNLVDGETVPPPRRGAPRRRRLLPRGRRRQGHRDVLRHRQRRRQGLRLLARRRVRLRRLGRLRPQGDGHHRPRRLGVGAAALPRARHRLPDRGLHRGRHRRHVRRRVRQRHAAAPSTSGWSPPSTTATSSSTPTPTPAASYAERQRLFDLPRSSWQDYDTSLISEGGGVFPRIAEVDPARRRRCARALGIDDDVTAMTPAELMKAILLAPVDLLWNGGIGTYVKAADETHADAGDKANDAIRVNGERAARQVRRRGRQPRPHPARPDRVRPQRGGRINTDFIDNSAGVDTSDHEVNIKILLDRVVADGDLTEKQRNALLAEMTDEVAALVLRDNYEQNLALANAAANAALAAARPRGLDAAARAATACSTASSRGCPPRGRCAGGSSAARA